MMALIEPFIGWIMMVFAAVTVLVMAFLSGSQSGKSREQKKQLEQALGNVQDAQENDDEIKAMDESAIDHQLDDNGWMRNNK